MNKIYKVSRFPTHPDPTAIYYNRTTREIIINVNSKFRKFQAIHNSLGYLDAISISKYYPLFSSELDAKNSSPLGTATAYGEVDLGPAPEGVSYPVYMPDGISGSNKGDYVNPIGDDDGDGVLNFRDPDFIGISGLPVGNYDGIDPFTTSNNIEVNIKEHIGNPDEGSLNDTGSDLLISTPYSGIMVGPDGEIQLIIGPGAAILPAGFTFFEDTGNTSVPLGEPTPKYTGVDPFVTSGGSPVNIKDYIDNPDSGSANNSLDHILINTINPGIIIGPNGEIEYFLPGVVSLPPGYVLFRELDGDVSLLPPTDYEGVDPYTTSGGVDVNIKDHISDPGSGSSNEGSTEIRLQVTEESILVMPDGTVTQVGPGVVVIPPGGIIFSDISSLIDKAVDGGIIEQPIPPEAPDATSFQWFEEGAGGDLVLRSELNTSADPAIQYWEPEGSFDYIPRESPYISTEENTKYFEENTDGDITVTNNHLI